MTHAGEYTRREFLSQPEAWIDALERIQAQADSLHHLYRAMDRGLDPDVPYNLAAVVRPGE